MQIFFHWLKGLVLINIFLRCDKRTLSSSDACFAFISRELDREIADLVFNGVTIKSKLCEESATIIASVNSVEMVYPCSKKFILLVGRVSI